MCPSRRTFLRTAGGGLGTAGLVGLAGCSGLLDDDRRGIDGTLGVPRTTDVARDAELTAVDPPTDGEPTYVEWLPAPAALPTSREDYAISYVSFDAFRDHADRFPVDGGRLCTTFDRTRWFRFYLGLFPDEVTCVTGFGFSVVVEGGFDAADVCETLEASRFDPVGRYHGYDIYEKSVEVVGGSDSTAGVVAVGADAVVSDTSTRASARDVVETVVDAKRGAVDRYPETDDTCGRLVEAVGAPAYAFVVPYQSSEPTRFAASTGSATIVSLDDEGYYVSLVLPFDPDDDRRGERADELTDELRDQSLLREHAEQRDVETRQSLVRLDERTSYEGYAAEALDWDAPTRPVVTWGVAYDATDRTVTIRHDGGQPVAASRLGLETSMDDPIETQFADEYETVERGASVTVDVAELGSEPTLSLVWRSESSWVHLLGFTPNEYE
ncbi:hypothetical protein [Haloarchaeobius sp. HRN-SO-5]|uniref:hypothetical protein n=1 Tax=Haloarchaeobius sp. HRN-SO-5 TaxID=3446118 RepID=UPI003EB9FD6F